jgi:hypothetical protein
VEVFGDTGILTWGTWQVAMVTTVKPLILLDLRGNGAMRAGTVAALCKVPDRSLTQAWVRFFYHRTDLYQTAAGEAIHGLLYSNAHNDDDAVCLYERAEGTLTCASGAILHLADPDLLPLLAAIGHDCHIVIPPVP